MGRFRRMLRRGNSAAARTGIAIAKRKMANDPRSFFYGDPVVDIQPEEAADAIAAGGDDVATEIVASTAATPDQAAERVEAYQTLPLEQRAQITLLPPLAVWNAQVIQNPVVGQISAFNLNYNLQKNLNEMPYQGATFSAAAVQDGADWVATVNCAVLDSTSTATYGIPIMTFVISNSSLNTPIGGLVTLRFKGEDVNGNKVDTTLDSSQYAYTFQRMVSTEATKGVFIPFQVVATRTLPFMPIFKYGASDAKSVQFKFSGLASGDVVYVNVLGYASQELREIAATYNLPAGQLA